MSLRTTLLTFAAFALAVCTAARAQEPQKDQQVIDDFVTTRGMSFTGSGKQTQQRAKPAPTPRRNSAKSKRPSGSPSGDAASGKTPAGKGGAASKPNGVVVVVAPEAAVQSEGAVGDGAQLLKAGGGARRPLALGFTLFMKDDEDRLFFVEPSREFKTGDRLAISFETNADGYLYMFNPSDGANTLDMVFPDAMIDEGANALQAHTYATFPTESNQSFAFIAPPGAEHLFIVFSREPLADVPTGEALVEFCRGKGEACTWHLSAAQWERIREGVKGRRVTEARNTQLAQLAQPEMQGMIQRGLKVKSRAPKPAFVRSNDSPDANILVTEIVLTHK
jgi:hypothetical protein